MKALAILLVLAAPALADHKLAESYFHAGAQAYRAQNFDVAAQNFKLAYDEWALPEIAFSAAQAYRRQYRVDHDVEKLRNAVAMYEAYLKVVKAGGRVADATDSLDDLKRELDKIDPRAHGSAAPAVKKTQLRVSIMLGGASPMGMHEIEDKDMGQQPTVVAKIDNEVVPAYAPHDVTPGDHVVRGEAPGYAALEKKVHAFEDVDAIVELELQPLPARVTFDTEPGARISVDGRGVGTTPMPATDVAAGKHVLTIVRTGREPIAREFSVARGDKVTLHDDLDATGRRRIVVWFVIADGVLGAAAITSAVAAFYEDRNARKLRDDIRSGDQSSDVAAEYNDARDKRDAYRTGALTLGVGTVAVAMLAAWLYYYDRPSAEGMHVTPIAAPGGGAVVMTGRW